MAQSPAELRADLRSAVLRFRSALTGPDEIRAARALADAASDLLMDVTVANLLTVSYGAQQRERGARALYLASFAEPSQDHARRLWDTDTVEPQQREYWRQQWDIVAARL